MRAAGEFIFINILISGEEVNAFRQILNLLKETSQKSREDIENEFKNQKDKKQQKNVDKSKPVFNSDILSENTIAILKEKCRELGLNLSGNKADLVDRLRRYLLQQQLPVHEYPTINNFLKDKS